MSKNPFKTSAKQNRDRGRDSQPRPRPRLNSQPEGATKRGWVFRVPPDVGMAPGAAWRPSPSTSPAPPPLRQRRLPLPEDCAKGQGGGGRRTEEGTAVASGRGPSKGQLGPGLSSVVLPTFRRSRNSRVQKLAGLQNYDSRAHTQLYMESNPTALSTTEIPRTCRAQEVARIRASTWQAFKAIAMTDITVPLTPQHGPAPKPLAGHMLKKNPHVCLRP